MPETMVTSFHASATIAMARSSFQIIFIFDSSLDYTESHGSPSSAVAHYGGWMEPWRKTQRVSSEALASEEILPALVAFIANSAK